jgi:predicted nucleotidyltransferase component of viral defense system
MNAIITQLDTQKHKFILMSILLGISKNKLLKKSLIFKWETALFLLYWLDRFSTDLDFDVIDGQNYENIWKEINNILEWYGEVKNSYIKRNTIFSLLSYGNIDHNIKIEISTRWISGNYTLKNFLWIQLNILDIWSLSANTFIALKNRSKIANRDIYDIYFILKNNFDIDIQIIELRSEMSFREYIVSMIDFLENLPKKYNILDWLWVTLNEKQKYFVKNNLIPETIFLLHTHI